MSRFIIAGRETTYLLPPSVDECLPERHLARFALEVSSSLDLSGLTGQYADQGCVAYNPAMLLSLLIYGYATGLFSSRKIERMTYDSIAFRPGFLPQIEALFVQLLMLTHAVKLGWVVLDSTKVKTNASKRQGAVLWVFEEDQVTASGRSESLDGARHFGNACSGAIFGRTADV